MTLGFFFTSNEPWTVKQVSRHDRRLVDRTGTFTVGTTDPMTRTIYLTEGLPLEFAKTVLMHEMVHAILYDNRSYRLIHQMVKPSYWFYAEEAICNLVAENSVFVSNQANLLLTNY